MLFKQEELDVLGVERKQQVEVSVHFPLHFAPSSLQQCSPEVRVRDLHVESPRLHPGQLPHAAADHRHPLLHLSLEALVLRALAPLEGRATVGSNGEGWGKELDGERGDAERHVHGGGDGRLGGLGLVLGRGRLLLGKGGLDGVRGLGERLVHELGQLLLLVRVVEHGVDHGSHEGRVLQAVLLREGLGLCGVPLLRDFHSVETYSALFPPFEFLLSLSVVLLFLILIHGLPRFTVCHLLVAAVSSIDQIPQLK